MDEPDPDPTVELAEFRPARTSFEAKVIAAVLADAGIPAYVAGDQLADEFAMSQRLMNLQNVTIQVPRDRLEDAEQALAAAREAGQAMAADTEPTGEPEPAPLRGRGLKLLGIILVFAPAAVALAFCSH